MIQLSFVKFIISKKNEKGVKMAIEKAYLEVDNIETTEKNDTLQEFRGVRGLKVESWG